MTVVAEVAEIAGVLSTVCRGDRSPLPRRTGGPRFTAEAATMPPREGSITMTTTNHRVRARVAAAVLGTLALTGATLVAAPH